jgi:hypothetical protein
MQTLKCQIMHLEALVRALLGGNNRSIADQRVVNARIRHQVGLELVEIHIESSVESQTGGDGADDLGNQAIEMLVVRTRDIQVATADIINSLVVDQESTVRMLNCAVGGQNGIVRLHDGSGHTRSGVDCKFKLALLPIVGSEALEKQSSESRASASSKGMEDEETLKRLAVVWCSSVSLGSLPADWRL